MPPPPLELTLVLAATRDMGIGLHGGLPWTGLKKEMAYFARVTKRLSPPPPSPSPSPPPPQEGHGSAAMNANMNAVIMGRKTWESIPPRFRPLKGRLNVVISKSAPAVPTTTAEENREAVVMAPSLETALSYLGSGNSTSTSTSNGESGGRRVFVIGGGQIYGAALKMKETKRILLTRVLTDFECDTFFPLALGGGGDNNGEGYGDEWKRSNQERMDEWVGEEVPRGVQEENGTRYEFEMWER